MRKMSPRSMWIRWLLVWGVLTVVFGAVTPLVVGPLFPAPASWVSGLVLASALTFLFVPSPHDG
jgi:hypothetical protein